jgi:hypothetical protein
MKWVGVPSFGASGDTGFGVVDRYGNVKMFYELGCCATLGASAAARSSSSLVR